MDDRTRAARAAEGAAAELDALSDSLSGDLLTPESEEYDGARRVWNGLVNRYPAAVAYCESVPDVRAAVRAARESDLPASVRSGGHHVAGSCVAAAGLVVDCSRMDSVRVDPEERTATVGPGATWGDLDRATTAFGLATPGGVVSDTGVAGLTLGGGTGYLSRKHGLAADNLTGADVVCADGELRRASAARNPELFWALRGGDGGFGVVTAFEFDLHPVPEALAVCELWYPAERAPELLADFAAYYGDAPDEALVAPYLARVPDTPDYPEHGGEDAVVFFGTYAGDPAAGERELERFRYGDPIADESTRMAYTDLQTAFDDGFPHGRRYYWKSVYTEELEGLIDRLCERAALAPAESSIVVWPMGGAVNRVESGATAFRRRDAAFVCSIEAGWDDPMANAENVAWVRETADALREAGAGGPIPNFEGDTDDAAADDLYGEARERLRAVKVRYDPAGRFVGGRIGFGDKA
jgi:FAD/FMN-containing dehydrogenase